jgi:hypothetical protein
MILAATIELQGTNMVERIKEALKCDNLMQKVLEAANNGIKEPDGTIQIRGLLYVPPALEQEVIQMHHDPPAEGHQGIDKTCEKISRNYLFQNMRKKVERYINNCESCARNKPARHAPYGKLQNPEVPEHPWEWVTVDFVGPLPKTKNKNDYLAVITDRLTKYIHRVPTKTDITAKEMAELFVKQIVMNHGIPKYLISDRDKLFTSNSGSQ